MRHERSQPPSRLPPDAPSPLQALEHRCDRLQRIVDALADVAALRLAPEDMLQHIALQAMEITGASGAVIELVDGDELEYVATAGTVAAFTGLRLRSEDSLSGLCIRQRLLQTAIDTETDPRVDREACRRIGARSMLVTPICHDGDAIGVVKVLSTRADAFDATDASALRLAAGLIGHALARQFMVDVSQRLLQERSLALARISTVIAASPVAIVVHDLDSIVQMWNPAAERLFGWTEAEVVGRRPPYLPPEEIARFETISDRLVREGTAASEVVKRQRRDGQLIDVRVSGAALHDSDGRVVGIVRTLEDVSEQQAAAQALKAGAERLRNIIANADHAFVSMDDSGRTLEWNYAAEHLFGWTRQEALMRPLAELIIPEASRDAHDRGIRRYLESGNSTMLGRRLEVTALRRDGSTVPVELSINTAQVEGRPVFDAFLQDISERRAQMDLLRQQSELDSLTRVANREAFHVRLQRALATHEQQLNEVGVVVLNLDGFSAINNLYGHATGDVLLRETARRLSVTVREGDLVARLGDDEFALLFESLRDARADLSGITRKLLAVFDEPMTVRGSPLPLHASFGAAIHEYAHDDVEALLHRANEALARAKAEGGQRVVMMVREAPVPD